jgi:hypothetical protein
MKEYDVHFEVVLHDFISAIEANSKLSAENVTDSLIHDPRCNFIKKKLHEYIDSDDFQIKFTDTLEIGKDI